MEAMNSMGSLRAVYSSLFGSFDEMKAALRPYVPTNCEIDGVEDVRVVHDTVYATVRVRPVRAPDVIVIDYVHTVGYKPDKACDR